MRFSAEHRFPGPPGPIAAILGDPDFYRDLELPDLRLLEVRSIEASDTVATTRPDGTAGGPTKAHGLTLRYEFTGNLDVVALRLLGGERLTWSQEVQLFGASGGRHTFVAEANPRLLHGRADFALEPAEADLADRPDTDAPVLSTLRRLEGELTVALPVVGGMAERRIVAGVLTRLDVEADAARQRLARGLREGGATRRSR